ncbi:MAG TPA: pseudouridine synthase [Gemmataceae bacterium]|nr:pseudouridine synthase [Gemmataceae bacterium]
MAARSYIVGRSEAGRTVADWLRARLGLPAGDVHRLLRGGCVAIGGAPCSDPARRVKAGQRLQVRPPVAGKKKPPPKQGEPRGLSRRNKPAGSPGPGPVIVYADDHIVVVDKPPGLTTMRHPDEAAEFGERARRFLPPTLADLLPDLLAKGKHGGPRRVRAVHRIDNDTSGLVVFARTPEAERELGRQFRARSTDRVYLALVRGRAKDGRIESVLVRDRGDGRRGSGPGPHAAGQHAVTHVRVVEDLGDFTLAECTLETGRTHQVRIHLGEAGTPLCGERLYDRSLHGTPLPDGSGAKRTMLHAASLGFDHPATGERIHWTSALPRDMQEIISRLRQQ